MDPVQKSRTFLQLLHLHDDEAHSPEVIIEYATYNLIKM